MDLFSEKTVLTVSRLTALIRELLEDNFQQIWVQGEVSNLACPASGHIYFSLKDSSAHIRCVMFKGAARNLKFRLQDGMALTVRGRLSLYDQRGEYQILCDYLEPAGIGALQAAFMQLKERLFREGLFDEQRKRPLPRFPQRVGVITSPTGAAIHDVLTILKRRFAPLEVLIFPVRVQGEGAAGEIAEAIAEMNRLNTVDVLIVGRGGGSLEDLWAFNEEVVARAVYHSALPIISAVGHETDWTICDFAADLRAPTPSAAAELVIASTDGVRGQLDAHSHRLKSSLDTRISLLHARIEGLRRAMRDPALLLGHLNQRIDDLSGRLDRAFKNSLQQRSTFVHQTIQSLLRENPQYAVAAARQKVSQLQTESRHLLAARLEAAKRGCSQAVARLEVLSPLATLARGYSIVRRSDGAVVNDASTLYSGDHLHLDFFRGTASCTVNTVSTAENKLRDNLTPVDISV